MKLDRTGQTYGQLTALYDTGKRSKRGECIWTARCTNTIDGLVCGRVIETHKLGQKDGPTRCPECSIALFCTPRDVTGKVVSGWRAIRRYAAGDWKFLCLGCGRTSRYSAKYTTRIVRCRKCQPLPKPPQKMTTKNYPALTAQIAALRIKLARELSAGNVVKVPVGGGRYSAFVSAADAPRVLSHYWQIIPGNNDMFYAGTKIGGRKAQMHRFILGLTDSKILADHKDHCGINNTRGNVRPATNGQNAANRRKSAKPSHSPYKGVTWQSNTKAKPWMATIHSREGQKRVTTHLGRFALEADAARAYNAASVERFGEFACLNEVPERKPSVSVGLEEIAA